MALLPDLDTAISTLASRLDFAALLGQRGRMLQVETAPPTLALIPERMVMKDAVSRPFGARQIVLDPRQLDKSYLGKRRATGWGYGSYGESTSLVGVPVLSNNWRE